MKTANSESHLEPLKAKDLSHSEAPPPSRAATLGRAGESGRARERERKHKNDGGGKKQSSFDEEEEEEEEERDERICSGSK